MALPDLVLVHGGEHAADCWDLTIAELHRQAPDLRTLAVDLPGRGAKPGDLATATIDEWVDSVVADIDDADLGAIVIVGHSMAGVTVPGVVAKLGTPRVREMILATAFVPGQGQAIVDTLGGPLAFFARRAAKGGNPVKIPQLAAQYAFCNGMTRAQRQFTLTRLYAESARIPAEPVDRSGLPDDVPRTWILTTRDRALSQKSQQASITALGGVQHVIPIDACHEVMISHPEVLAGILIERCRLRGEA
ncbi:MULTISPECIES: alpha/beta fold hydrolase [Mycolicibacterium]|jgi:pimeloyl-ACP methyl ester carboxylesterase|uniref:Alpha/beta hydrolase n=3 Tax=Mycolicibacterium TaxID=1866885 RepID=A0A378U5D0_MYCFO|nr:MULTISPECIES: alpha/beta hydrolase [Mycolicibacterium]MCV7142442.1 alpha/beta fold hydrolase [Mycolicibacterium fortuitum]MDV7195517.1 alpha/beta hydrolase [Mycolicibacterium fortuitum]MDV7209177.1 alpha/beta hydrolase [Mycolicibacterium fortuitum]MDV7231041.1 alpha/beta hydrolase [Mycolicibacterium fortuitum]MDV7262601.1 alpha/beta hydrolase [Mycolicibacterium fortuitum]